MARFAGAATTPPCCAQAAGRAQLWEGSAAAGRRGWAAEGTRGLDLLRAGRAGILASMQGGARRLRGRCCAWLLALFASLAAGTGCEASSSSCEAVGCAQVPLCPATCSAECGCCSCRQGVRECGPGGVYECRGSCLQLVKACSTPDACVPSPDEPTAICAESSDSCPAIKRAYEAEVASRSSAWRERTVWPGTATLAAGSYALYDTSCERAKGCQVQRGHCEDGLGGPCWYLAESGEPLDHYAELYRSLGCATPTSCDCPSADIDVSCQDEQATAHCVVR